VSTTQDRTEHAVRARDTTARPDVLTAPSGGLKLTLVLGAFIALGPLTIDMYLPALPTIADELHATESATQLTLTGTLLGLGLGQLVLGPLADALGRRRPLLIGTAVHLLASLLVLIAPNVLVLGLLRVLQGAGAAAGAVICLAIVRDLFVGRAAATMLSRMMLVLAVSPVLAPALGGGLLTFTSWRGVFVALAAVSLFLLLAGRIALPETLPPARRRTVGVRSTLRGYSALLHDRVYVGLVLVAGLTMAGLFAYVSGSSFVYQEQYGLGEQAFALLFAAGAVWLIGATQLNPVMLRRWSPQQLLFAATVAGAVVGAVLVGTAATGLGGLWGVVVPLWAMLACCGVALPNAPTLALARHGEAAGTAAALVGAIQFGIGAVTSPLVGVLGNDAVAIGSVVLVALSLAIVVLVVVVKPWQLEDVPDTGGIVVVP
jgi:DHA1 family bicyclomycin/chloramphenicol resistance-like MFS transporter